MRRVLFVLLMSLVTQFIQAPSPASALSGRYVLATPFLGTYARPVRVFLTTKELDVVTRMSSHLRLSQIRLKPAVNRGVWHIEPGLEKSEHLSMQRQVVRNLQQVLEKFNGTFAAWHIDVIVGRSQSYIKSQLAELGCAPDLSQTGGEVLLGAAVCGRHVLISNLTGFLFLTAPDQPITSAMEQRREPRASSMPYQLEIRSLEGLAHEWAHSYRAAGQQGRVLVDEPAWVKEGLASMWASVSVVNTFQSRMTYRDWHVLRLRKFVHWVDQCNRPLREYRTVQEGTNGCEYFMGPLAVELLIARHGGLQNIVKVFHLHNSAQGFPGDFVQVYGMTIEEFEHEADLYIAQIRKAELTK